MNQLFSTEVSLFVVSELEAALSSVLAMGMAAKLVALGNEVQF